MLLLQGHQGVMATLEQVAPKECNKKMPLLYSYFSCCHPKPAAWSPEEGCVYMKGSLQNCCLYQYSSFLKLKFWACAHFCRNTANTVFMAIHQQEEHRRKNIYKKTVTVHKLRQHWVSSNQRAYWIVTVVRSGGETPLTPKPHFLSSTKQFLAVRKGHRMKERCHPAASAVTS